MMPRMAEMAWNPWSPRTIVESHWFLHIFSCSCGILGENGNNLDTKCFMQHLDNGLCLPPTVHIGPVPNLLKLPVKFSWHHISEQCLIQPVSASPEAAAPLVNGWE